MTEDLDLDHLIEHVGGPFRFTALVQKRLQELIRSGAHLPEGNQFKLLQLVFREIERDEINLELAETGPLMLPDSVSDADD